MANFFSAHIQHVPVLLHKISLYSVYCSLLSVERVGALFLLDPDPEQLFRTRIQAKVPDPCGSGSTTLGEKIVFKKNKYWTYCTVEVARERLPSAQDLRALLQAGFIQLQQEGIKLSRYLICLKSKQAMLRIRPGPIVWCWIQNNNSNLDLTFSLYRNIVVQ